MDSFNRIWQSIAQETQLKNRWVESTPWVIIRQPKTFARRGQKDMVRLTRLGSVRVYEFAHPGTRGKRKLLDAGMSGVDWKKCDVRLASPAVLEGTKAIDEEIARLHKARDELLRERLWDNSPLSFDEIQKAHEPWKRFYGTLDRFKKGEGAEEDLREAVEALFSRE